MTRLAALHARITGDASGFVTAAQAAEDAAQDAAAAMGAAGRGGGAGLSGATGKARGALSKLSSSPGMRMLPVQLSQVAQQAAAGTGVMRALSIQAADIGLAFGAVGAIVGTLATVAMPLIIGAFSGASDETNELEDQLGELQNAFDALIEAQEAAKASIQELSEEYGYYTDGVRQLIEAQLRLQERNLVDQFQGLTSALQQMNPALADAIAATSRLDNATRVFPSMEAAVAKLPPELARAARAINDFQVSSTDDLKEAGERALETALELERLNDPEFDPIISQLLLFYERTVEYLGGVREEVAATVNALARLGGVEVGGEGSEAVVAGQGAGMVGGLGGPGGIAGNRFGGVPLPEEDIVNPTPGGGRGGRGGGGARSTDTFERDLETLRDQLATEIEVEREMHEERQQMLNEALERELMTQQEYHDLMERERERHQEKMSDIDVYRYGTGLQQTEQFMGDMAAALASGNEEMVRIAKVFGAAESLINAWRAFSQVMADPTLPFIAKVPAAVGVLASAMQAVSAIRGVSSSGSGRRTASATTAPAAAGPANAGSIEGGGQSPRMQRSLTLIGDRFNRAQAEEIARFMNEGTDDGLVIRGRT